MAAWDKDQQTIQANLDVMGKIRNGDLLIEADSDGLLCRKTNAMTQWANKSQSATLMLYTQIVNVLGAAEKLIDKDGKTELTASFVAACKGIETLMSTYRSKGSKGTEAVDALMAVLSPFQSRLLQEEQRDQSAGPLKELAANAITFLENARVQSTNTPYSFSSYFGKDLDDLMLQLLVRISLVPGLADTHRQLRIFVNELVRDSTRSRDEKRLRLVKWLRAHCSYNVDEGSDVKTFMHKFWGLHLSRAGDKAFNQYMNLDPETKRIKLVRRALKTRFGNCSEKACIVATHIVEASHGNVGIGVVGLNGYDHFVTVISKDKKKLDTCLKTLEHPIARESVPEDTRVVDGWTCDSWGLRDWFNKPCGPRQMVVRLKTRYHFFNSGIISYWPVSWPPAGENAQFRLRFATLSKQVVAHQRIRAVLQGSLHETASLLNAPNRLMDSNGLDEAMDNDVVRTESSYSDKPRDEFGQSIIEYD